MGQERDKNSCLTSVTIIRFVGADAEQRQARNNNGSKFTVLCVTAQRSWKNTDDERGPSPVRRTGDFESIRYATEASPRRRKVGKKKNQKPWKNQRKWLSSLVTLRSAVSWPANGRVCRSMEALCYPWFESHRSRALHSFDPDGPISLSEPQCHAVAQPDRQALNQPA